MKIALVVPGGVDRSGEYCVIPALLALIERLSVRHEVHVFALRQEDRAGSWALAGAQIHNIGSGNTRLRAIRAICAEHRAGAFHAVQSIWSGSPGLVAVSAARMLGVPSFVHVAGGELVSMPEIGYGGRLTWKGRVREAAVLRTATAVTGASKGILVALERLGIAAKRLPLGVDLNRWPPRAPIRRDANRPARLIHAASLNLVKDQRTLLSALALVAGSGLDFELDIVGEDTLQGEIQALAQQLGLSGRVTFHGFLPHRRLRSMVEAAHLMIISSRHEAGPLVVLEAGVAGVPTVGTPVGHIEEWAPDGAAVVPIADSVALARAVAGLLGDEDARLRLAHEAWHRATRDDADCTARSFQAMYADLAK
ncbi:MAG TPA: glycosyltransferase family 4 protein [Steroidobacteraceae bacterium]